MTLSGFLLNLSASAERSSGEASADGAEEGNGDPQEYAYG
jgi:hypothetical protein